MRDERGLLESHSALAEEMTQPIPPFIEENKRLKRWRDHQRPPKRQRHHRTGIKSLLPSQYALPRPLRLPGAPPGHGPRHPCPEPGALGRSTETWRAGRSPDRDWNPGPASAVPPGHPSPWQGLWNRSLFPLIQKVQKKTCFLKAEKAAAMKTMNSFCLVFGMAFLTYNSPI